MKILLTGGNGMVGKNILAYSKKFSHTFLSPASKELNLLNYIDVFSYIKKHQPEFIIHAAGLVGGIQANIKYPVDFLITNTDIGRNIILAAKENRVQKLLNLSSSCIYPKDADNPLQESSILKGALEPTNEGYALAKIFAMKLCEYINSQDSTFEYKTVIPCNLYGKHDKFSPEDSHMIPAVIKKIIDAKEKKESKVTIWGDGTARREFMYAEDLANFIFHAINNFNKMPQNINVGIGKDYSITEYYNIIAKANNFRGDFIYDTTKPVGMKQKLIDITKLEEFGWRHSTTLEEGILKTIQFYKENY